MKFKTAVFVKKRTENNFFKRFAVTSVIIVALFPSFASAFSYDGYLIFTQKAGQTLASSITSSVGKAQDFLVAGTEAATQNVAPTLASVSGVFNNISNYVSSFWKNILPAPTSLPTPIPTTTTPTKPTIVTPSPIKPAVATTPSPQSTASQPTSPGASQGVPTVVQNIILPSTSSDDLNTRIEQLRNELLAKIGSISAQDDTHYQANFQAIALTNKIDQLTNTVITTPTITGGSITNASISGATISGTTLSVSSGTFSGNLTVSGTGTSTFAGDSNFDSATLYVDSLNNRVGIGTTSPSDTFALNGPAYLGQISAPSVTVNRLYNQGGLLYFNGTALGGGGSSSWATTTSQVSGQLVNYPLNATDIVAIGSSSTTTAPFWFNPNNTTAYISGKLGIGTTSPYASLSVVGQVVGSYFTATSTTATSTFSGNFIVSKHGAFGADAGIDKIYPEGAVAQSSILDIRETFTTTAASNGIYIRNTINPTGTSAAYSSALNGEIFTAPGNAQNITGGIVGLSSFVNHEGTGTLSDALGSSIYVYNSSSGTITTANGTLLALSNVGAGTITNAYGVSSNISNDGAGTITNAYGVVGNVAANGGIITNAYNIYSGDIYVDPSAGVTNSYGVYIANQTAAGATHYALYSAGGKSYFAGNVGIGTTTPAFGLDVSAVTRSGDYFIGTSNTSPKIVYVGDSLTTGNGLTPYTSYITPPTYNGMSYVSYNIGVASRTLQTMAQQAYSNLNPLYSQQAGSNIVVIWGGTNDLFFGATASTTFSYLQQFAQHQRNLGFKVIVATMISRSGLDSKKNSYNSLIRSNWPLFADGLADVAANANLGADGAYANTTYFNPDGTHLTNTGYALVGGIVQTALTNLITGSVNTLTGVGNIGIGTTSPSAGLHVGSVASGKNVRVANGWLCVDDNDTCTGATTAGTVYAVGAYTTGADLAENYQAFEEGLTPGDIVSVTDTQTISTTTVDSFGVKKAIRGETIIGIVSTKPGLLLANSLLENIPVALQGRVPVKVNGEGGSIKVGDRITLSSTPGVGMKATTSSYTIGIALEGFAGSDTSTTGTITAFVNLSWSRLDPAISNGTITTIEGKESSFWSIDESSGRIKYIAPVDFNDFDLIGIRAIMGSAGKWSIDASGNFVANKVTAQAFCIDDLCIDKDKLRTIISRDAQEGGSSDVQTHLQNDNPPVASDPEQPATSTVSTTTSDDDVSEDSPAETSTTDPPVEEATEDIIPVATFSDDHTSTTSEAVSH